MKIIQSFWTKPFLKSADSLKDARLNGGWPARKYNYFSWALSCLQLRDHYNEVSLVTDDLGKFILVDKIGLPYTDVVADMNKLDHHNAGLWALGKIYAYSIQDAPFLHVDSDVFISRKFDDRITGAALTAQNLEARSIVYAETFNDICDRFTYVPPYLKGLQGMKYISCSNAGILGGTDIPFFKHYTDEIFQFVDRNQDYINANIHHLNTAYINVVYEQIFFYQMAQQRDTPITYLFPDVVDFPNYIGYFHEGEPNGGFVHCLGIYKQGRHVCAMLELQLKTAYPEYYHRILDLIASSEI
jgi:hypothetical protein